MLDDINKKLHVLEVLKGAYHNLFVNIKSFIFLSYIIMAPLFLLGYVYPISINQDQPFTFDLLIYLLFTLTLFLLLSIFLFRLFMVGQARQFKITPAELLKMFKDTFIYTIALVCVIILAFLSVGLLFALMLSIINSVAGENALSGPLSSTIISSVIFVFLMLIILRTQPTFISIAIKADTLPMKSAYYYTRDNNKQLLAIGILGYLPLLIGSTLILILMNNFITPDNVLHTIFSYLITPINLLPVALQMSAGVEIYKCLVPINPAVHNGKMDISV